MSVGDCFLKLDQIPGEAQDGEHVNEIQVLSWNWSVEARTVDMGVTTGRADVRMFEFFHQVDSASAGLWQRCINNAVVARGELSMRRAGERDKKGVPHEYLKIVFQKVRVTHASLVFDEQHVIPLEKVRLAFEKVDFDYTPQSSGGGSGGGKKGFGWTMQRGV